MAHLFKNGDLVWVHVNALQAVEEPRWRAAIVVSDYQKMDTWPTGKQEGYVIQLVGKPGGFFENVRGFTWEMHLRPRDAAQVEPPAEDARMLTRKDNWRVTKAITGWSPPSRKHKPEDLI